MNWGKGLIIGMSIFMLFIIAMVMTMFNQPADDYDKQYYEKGLAYDSTYNKEKQVITDNARPMLKVGDSAIVITFTAPAVGHVKFSRPSDSSMDRMFTVKTNRDNKYIIPASGLAKGQWQLVMEWESNKKQYRYKQEITIP